MSTNYELKLTDSDFSFLAKLARQQSGIELNEKKRQMVYSRLNKRVRELNCINFSDYCDYIRANSDEVKVFINSITTNVTAFYRENHHFEFLVDTIFCDANKNYSPANQRFRIWSAGCSSGQEPYTIAIHVKDHLLRHNHWDVKILATDLDSDIIAKAKAGLYPESDCKKIDPGVLAKWFTKSKHSNRTNYQVSPELQSMITFNQLNLLHDWPMKGPFDIIFCRNVIIYFDKQTQIRLFQRYYDLLKPGGYLFIGHSETLHGISDKFVSVGRTIYQKLDDE